MIFQKLEKNVDKIDLQKKNENKEVIQDPNSKQEPVTNFKHNF